jgi:hypothetical protein
MWRHVVRREVPDVSERLCAFFIFSVMQSDSHLDMTQRPRRLETSEHNSRSFRVTTTGLGPRVLYFCFRIIRRHVMGWSSYVCCLKKYLKDSHFQKLILNSTIPENVPIYKGEGEATALLDPEKEGNTVIWNVRSHQRRTQREVCCWAARPKPPKTEIYKTQILLLLWYQKIYVISPSAEISHWNRLLTSTLEFWKIN